MLSAKERKKVTRNHSFNPSKEKKGTSISSSSREISSFTKANKRGIVTSLLGLSRYWRKATLGLKIDLTNKSKREKRERAPPNTIAYIIPIQYMYTYIFVRIAKEKVFALVRPVLCSFSLSISIWYRCESAVKAPIKREDRLGHSGCLIPLNRLLTLALPF